VPQADATEVTFAWTDDTGDHTARLVRSGSPDEKPSFVPTGRNVKTKWVEFRPVVRP
jgi:hypothetical protein